MMVRQARACAAMLMATAWASSATSAEPKPDRTPEGKAPLAGVPSQPGPHVGRIRELGDDAWLNLGRPAADPKWGVARGRAWTPKMPLAPELRAAFLCGCGIHGFTKPDGHFMDDLWAYDINGHRWVCLYPGANVKTLDLKLDKDGFEANKDGEHIPVSFMGHGYNNQAYIAHLHKLMLIYCHSPWWTRALPQRWNWLDQQHDDVRRRNYGHAGPIIEASQHPLFYDVAAGRWQRTFVAGDGPGKGRFEGVLEYLPARKQAFFLCRGRVWLYDFERNAWTASRAEQVPIGYDSWGCYDPKRDRIYVARKQLFLAYDVAADKWAPIQGDGQPEDLGSCAFGALTFDTAADALLIHRSNGAGIDIYHPARNAWSKAAPAPGVDYKRRNLNAFYDPELNAHFYHLAGDSDDNGFVLAYRYRRAVRQ